MVFGLPWWRLCLFIHHWKLIPTTALARNRPARSLAGPDSKTCRWAASWARNANCVNRIPSAAAISNWNQLWPNNTNPVTAPPSPSANATNRLM